jgi:hypothetical protein
MQAGEHTQKIALNFFRMRTTTDYRARAEKIQTLSGVHFGMLLPPPLCHDMTVV